MDVIQTTGGVFTSEDRKCIIRNICDVFKCKIEDVKDLEPLQEGLSNIVFSFYVRDQKYVYRHPGLGSEELVNRAREAILQSAAEDAGADKTVIAIDAKEGWRIAKYIEHISFDYNNPEHMNRAMELLKKLHGKQSKVRCAFDVIEKAERLKANIPVEDYGKFETFETIKSYVYKLDEFMKTDAICKCNIHGDARDDNFLINDKELHLVDWEWARYGDHAYDIASYICGGDHTDADVENILLAYYGKELNEERRRHLYACLTLNGWLYLHWTMLKESKGQKVGILKERWQRYAIYYGKKAIKMYEERK